MSNFHTRNSKKALKELDEAVAIIDSKIAQTTTPPGKNVPISYDLMLPYSYKATMMQIHAKLLVNCSEANAMKKTLKKAEKILKRAAAVVNIDLPQKVHDWHEPAHEHFMISKKKVYSFLVDIQIRRNLLNDDTVNVLRNMPSMVLTKEAMKADPWRARTNTHTEIERLYSLARAEKARHNTQKAVEYVVVARTLAFDLKPQSTFLIAQAVIQQAQLSSSCREFTECMRLLKPICHKERDSVRYWLSQLAGDGCVCRSYGCAGSRMRREIVALISPSQ